MFNTLITELRTNLAAELPGQDAQFKMVPAGRERTRLQNIGYKNPKIAAVLVLFYPVKGVPHIVLMKRNSYPGVHSAQISFPGGKVEKHDKHLGATALRESQEELGIISERVEMLGKLTQVYIPPSNFLVNPFVGFSETRPQFVPDSKEVTEVLEVPYSFVLDPVNFKDVAINISGSEVKVPAYILNNHVVWGATAMMLSELSHVLPEV